MQIKFNENILQILYDMFLEGVDVDDYVNKLLEKDFKKNKSSYFCSFEKLNLTELQLYELKKSIVSGEINFATENYISSVHFFDELKKRGYEFSLRQKNFVMQHLGYEKIKRKMRISGRPTWVWFKKGSVDISIQSVKNDFTKAQSLNGEIK